MASTCTLRLRRESAAGIVVLTLLGQVIEEKATHRPPFAVLIEIGARLPHARRRGAGKTIIDQVQVGDILRVRPGDKVRVDGVLVEGESAIDESMISGEALPVDKGGRP